MRWSSWHAFWCISQSPSSIWCTTTGRTRRSYGRDVARRPALRKRPQIQTTGMISLQLASAAGYGPTSFVESMKLTRCDAGGVAPRCASSLSLPTRRPSARSSTTSRARLHRSADLHQPTRRQRTFLTFGLDGLRFEPDVHVSLASHHARPATALFSYYPAPFPKSSALWFPSRASDPDTSTHTLPRDPTEERPSPPYRLTRLRPPESICLSSVPTLVKEAPRRVGADSASVSYVMLGGGVFYSDTMWIVYVMEGSKSIGMVEFNLKGKVKDVKKL